MKFSLEIYASAFFLKILLNNFCEIHVRYNFLFLKLFLKVFPTNKTFVISEH